MKETQKNGEFFKDFYCFANMIMLLLIIFMKDNFPQSNNKQVCSVAMVMKHSITYHTKTVISVFPVKPNWKHDKYTNPTFLTTILKKCLESILSLPIFLQSPEWYRSYIFTSLFFLYSSVKQLRDFSNIKI